MFLKLMRLVAPFAAIARELSIIRELYELELGSRNPPIIRITETPGKSDTTVTYADDAPKAKSALRKLMDGEPVEEEEEDFDLL